MAAEVISRKIEKNTFSWSLARMFSIAHIVTANFCKVKVKVQGQNRRTENLPCTCNSSAVV